MSETRTTWKLRRVTGTCLACLLLLTGCPSSKSKPEVSEAEAQPQISEYPLRTWIVADVFDASRIERQWLAGSDQPIEIRSLTTDELLSGSSCECDLLLFPSRLLGELVHRKWVAHLPAAVESADKAMDSELSTSPAAAVAQTQYGNIRFALPLGCSVPVVIASQKLEGELSNSPASWEQLLALIGTEDAFTMPPSEDVDRQALVDRYLTIVSALVDRNPNYGLLFEMQTMQSRLSQPEFVEAGRILKALIQQPGGASAIVGSHDAAWEFVTQHSGAAVAIASPVMLSQEKTQSKTGMPVDVLPRGQLKGWNVGGGLVAALAADCRQTSLAIGMLKWLRQRKTQESIAPVVSGIAVSKADSGADSLNWQVLNGLGQALNDATLPQEPRLRAADSYRDALATELLQMLDGQKTVEQALADAGKAWSKITDQQSKVDVQADYEKSLGLTL